MLTRSMLLLPDWPAPPHVQAAFTTRAGGASLAPFDSLNLGDHVHDNPAHVLHNRHALQASIAAKPVFLRQVHGVDVYSVDAQTPDGAVADACVTTQRGVACTIMVADCLPVLFTDRAGSFVAAAHAGWRGLLGRGGEGVLEQVYKAFVPLAQQNVARAAIKNVVPGGRNGVASEVLAWLGPCIGPGAFEVGVEVQAAFVAAQPGAAQHFQKINPSAADAHPQVDKYLCNLSGLARARLQALGITHIYGNDASAPWCTVDNPLQFFSHRRDAARLGSTGRMAACVWLA